MKTSFLTPATRAESAEPSEDYKKGLHNLYEIHVQGEIEDRIIETMLNRDEWQTSENKIILSNVYDGLKKSILCEEMAKCILSENKKSDSETPEDDAPRTWKQKYDGKYAAWISDAKRYKNICLQLVLKTATECCSCDKFPEGNRIKMEVNYYGDCIDQLFEQVHEKFIVCCENAGVEIIEIDIPEKFKKED